MDRQNVAYDLSMYESLLETKPEKQERTQHQAKTVKLKNKRAFKTALNVLSIAVMVSMIIGIVHKQPDNRNHNRYLCSAKRNH